MTESDDIPTEDRPPILAGRWRLEGMVGAGGLGSVYRARDLELGEAVALKVVAANDDVAMLRDEVRLARRVTHRNVARTFDIGDHGGLRFLTMELVEGEAMVGAGTFRADLLFRVGVVTVRIPPLRERGDDVLVLAERLLADLGANAPRRVTGFAPSAREALKRYAWPGNVRELRNAIEHALVLGEGALVEASGLPEGPLGSAPARAASGDDVVKLPMDLASLEARAIESALRAQKSLATGGACSTTVMSQCIMQSA